MLRCPQPGTYDLWVKGLAYDLLEVCEEVYNASLDIPTLTWIGEMVSQLFPLILKIRLLQRGVRQTNAYDCGPFVAADFVSLLHSDEPSTKHQGDMRGWRAEMADHMRSLTPAVVKRKKRSAAGL